MTFRFTENYITNFRLFSFEEGMPGLQMQHLEDTCTTFKGQVTVTCFAQVFTRLHPMRKNRLLFHNQLSKLPCFTVFNYDNLY